MSTYEQVFIKYHMKKKSEAFGKIKCPRERKFCLLKCPHLLQKEKSIEWSVRTMSTWIKTKHTCK
jgi:hypothetical protein